MTVPIEPEESLINFGCIGQPDVRYVVIFDHRVELYRWKRDDEEYGPEHCDRWDAWRSARRNAEIGAKEPRP